MHKNELRELLDAYDHEGVGALYKALEGLDTRKPAQDAVSAALSGLGRDAIEKLAELVQGVVRRRRTEFRTLAERRYAEYAKNALGDVLGDDAEVDDIREAEVVETDDGAWVTAYYFVHAYDAEVGQKVLPDDETYAECENCGRRVFNRDALDTSADMLATIEPGEEMPAGRCHHCGALCYIVRRDESSKILPAGKLLPKKEN